MLKPNLNPSEPDTKKAILKTIGTYLVFIVLSFFLSLLIVNTCFSQTTYFEEGFEGHSGFVFPDGWKLHDGDGDGYDWRNLVFTVGAHSGDQVATSPTSQTPVGVASDNWLITPQIDLADTAILSFWAKSNGSSSSGDVLEDFNLLLSVTGDSTIDFTILIDSVRVVPREYTQYTYDLSAYAGQQIHLAWQVVSMNKGIFNLDDIKISENVDVWPELTIVSPTHKEKFYYWDTVMISLNPIVSSGTIDSVEIFLDDELIHTIRDTAYEYGLIASEYEYGTYYEIKVRAFNDLGHYDEKEIDISFYDVFPDCKILYPSGDANIFQGTIVPISAVSEDIDTVGIGYKKSSTAIHYYIDDSLHFIDNTPPYFYFWDTEGMPTGQYTIKVQAFDPDSNQNSLNVNVKTEITINLIEHYTDDRIEWNHVYENIGVDEMFYVQNLVTTEFSTDIIQCSDSGYVVSGFSNTQDMRNGYLLKLNKNGDTVWTRFVDIDKDYTEDFFSVVETFDNSGISSGYIACGVLDLKAWTTSSDLLVVKFDTEGNKEWVKGFTSPIRSQNEGQSIKQTYDGGYIVTGYQGITNGGVAHTIVAANAWVIKMDKDGNEVWNNTYGDDAYFDFASDIVQTTDSGYVFTGYTTSYSAAPDSGKADAWICKLDKNGEIVWSKMYGGDEADIMYSIDNTSDGGFVVAGFTLSYGAEKKDGWVLRLNSEGDTVWTKIYRTDKYESISSIKQTHGGSFIACGNKVVDLLSGEETEDVWVFKIDANGSVLWDENYGGGKGEGAKAIIQTYDGGYILTSNTYSFGMGSGGEHSYGFGISIWVIKINSDEYMGVVENNLRNSDVQLSNYPNPFSQYTYINVDSKTAGNAKLSIFDATGNQVQLLYQGTLPKGEKQFYFDANGLKNGLYFYRLETEKGIVTKKLIKL